MALAFEHLVVRTPVFNRQREIVFYRLTMKDSAREAVMPFMLRMLNIEAPQSGYFIPLAWAQDEVVLEKLSKNTILLASETDDPAAVTRARAAGYRLAITETLVGSGLTADFRLLKAGSHAPLTPDSILDGIDTPAGFAQSMNGTGMLFSGNAGATAVQSGSKRINPAHVLILELIAAVQQEADAKAIELMFKRDIALSFKLLRYINSPGFGLATRIDSIRHALSILGYQQLLKWLTLLAATAGQATSPALTATAITRARLMELLGTKRLDKREADNLFMTGMLSLLDRIIGMPLAEILANTNLPPAITEALLHDTGKYRRYLQLAEACEGVALADADPQIDLDAIAVSATHLEAIEWATQICAEGAG